MIDIRALFFIFGVLLCIIACLMNVPLLVDFFWEEVCFESFALSTCITGFVGLIFVFANRPHDPISLTVREAFLLTVTLWVGSTFVVSLPFYLSGHPTTFIDALFEGTASLTTTGATVLANLDYVPRAIILWRTMLQWFGGIGIIVMALSILPMLRIGGMQLFRSEFSDPSEKILPRVSQIASHLFMLYSILSLVCVFLLYIAGMTGFEAICHGLSTLATSGQSTSSGSIQAFHSWTIEVILMFFMIVGGGPLMLYIKVWHSGIRHLIKDEQYRFYIMIMLISGLLLTIWHSLTSHVSLWQSLRHSFFTVISITTTTGYIVSDYTLWGGFATLLMMLLGMMGGCTGSTSGGLKVFRVLVFARFAASHLRQLRRPHGVYTPLFKGQPIETPIAFSVFIFIGFYIFSILALACALSLYDLSFTTALTGAISAISNLGVGAGQMINPTGSFASIEPGAKCLLMFGMVLGRLELMTILVLFLPSFWKD